MKARNGIIFALALAALLGSGICVVAQMAGTKRVADAKPGEIRVLSTGAFKEPFDAIQQQAEKAIGHPILIEYGGARGNLKEEMLAGQAFEVALTLPDVIEEIAKAGKVVGASGVEIARIPVAIGLRGDIPNLDVSTPAALKKAMLGAKAIKYFPTGAGQPTAQKVIDDLQLAGKIHDASKVPGAVQLGPGEYELNFNPISEILRNSSLKNLGPVIDQFQVPSIITAVIGTNAVDVASAQALIKFLQGPAIDAALKNEGMEKGHVNTSPR